MATYFYTSNLISGLYYDINKPTKINESGNQIFIEDDIHAALTGVFSTSYISSGINITFNIALTSGEKNTLDTVITNHKNYQPSFIENIYRNWLLEKIDYFSYRDSIKNYYNNTISGNWSSLSLIEKRLLSQAFLVETGSRYQVLTQSEVYDSATKLLNNAYIGFFSLKASGIKDFSVANINTFIAGGSIYDKIGSEGGTITGNMIISGGLTTSITASGNFITGIGITGYPYKNGGISFIPSGDIALKYSGNNIVIGHDSTPSIGNIFCTGQGTDHATPFATTNKPVRISGYSETGLMHDFIMSASGQLKYIGTQPLDCIIYACASTKCFTNDTDGYLAVLKNNSLDTPVGTRFVTTNSTAYFSSILFNTINLQTNDTVSLVVINSDNLASFYVDTYNFLIKQI